MVTHFHTLETYWLSLASGEIPQLGMWSYLLLAALVAVEGPIATLLGAVAAASGLLRPGYVFLAASTGNLTADTLWYSLGYAGKIGWIKRVGQRLGLHPEYITWFERQMRTHAVKILFIAKLTMSLALPALIGAGLARVPWRRWFGTIFIAEGIWTGGLVLAGYYLSQFLHQLELGFQIAAGIGLVTALFFLMHYLKRHAPRFDGVASETQMNIPRSKLRGIQPELDLKEK